MVQSRKGKGGGYLLGRRGSAISLGEVVRVLDGPLAPIPCVSHTAYARCEECPDEETCAVRLAMKDVRDATQPFLDGTTLSAVNAAHSANESVVVQRREGRNADYLLLMVGVSTWQLRARASRAAGEDGVHVTTTWQKASPSKPKVETIDSSLVPAAGRRTVRPACHPRMP